jgi:hypothetical protein
MKILFVILMFVSVIGVQAQHDHHAQPEQKSIAPTFKDAKVGSAYTHYIALKDALVASNAKEAKHAATELEKSLSSISNGKAAYDAAKAIASSAELNEQRKQFTTLSNEITALVKSSKLTSGSLFVEYCPMANNNEGGYWLSNEKAIRNPYFGNSMLTCGSVKETIQ